MKITIVFLIALFASNVAFAATPKPVSCVKTSSIIAPRGEKTVGNFKYVREWSKAVKFIKASIKGTYLWCDYKDKYGATINTITKFKNCTAANGFNMSTKTCTKTDPGQCKAMCVY